VAVVKSGMNSLKPAAERDRLWDAGRARRKIYELVLKRFSAAFYPDCIFEVREILTKVDKNLIFRTRGMLIIRPGWQSLLRPGSGKEKKGADEPEQENIPPLEKGDSGDVTKSGIEDKKTSPPPKYTEALLLKDMTNPGRRFLQKI